MSDLYGLTWLDLALAVALVACFFALATVTALLIRARRKNAQLRRLMMTYRRSPRALRTAGRAVRVVTETAGRVRDQGVSGFLMSSIEDLTRWVGEDKSEIRRVAAADGTVTIFFSDIESSTALNEKLGDESWVKLLAKHDAVVRSSVDKYRGHIVKSQGDGFMIVFRDPAAAIRAGIAIQRALGEGRSRRLRRTPIRVRIGIHVGSAIEKDGDYFGRNVAMAARVAAQADGGEILVSDEVRAVMGDVQDITLTDVRAIELKGLSGMQTLWQVADIAR